MQLKNTTDFSDEFLRRMVAWCCNQIGYGVRGVKAARFRNRSRRHYAGRAHVFSKMISVSVGSTKAAWPTPPDFRYGANGEQFHDRIEALVSVTAHEIYHLAAYWSEEHKQRTRGGNRGSSERATRVEEVRVLRLFRARRETLLAEWSTATAKPAKEKPSAQEQRAAKVAKQLATWQRKLKLAQTKVKQYRRKAKYYDSAIAAKNGN